MTEKTFLNAKEAGEPLIKEVKTHHILLNNPSFFVNSMWN